VSPFVPGVPVPGCLDAVKGDWIYLVVPCVPWVVQGLPKGNLVLKELPHSAGLFSKKPALEKAK
jgi:hypothetical protein